MPKKVLIALPPGMLLELDFVATEQHRTRSDTVREGVRMVIEDHRRKEKELNPLNVPDDFSGLNSDKAVGRPSLASLSL